MRKKVSLIVMVLAILLMAHPSLKANAQIGACNSPPSMDQKKLQIQTFTGDYKTYSEPDSRGSEGDNTVNG